MQLRTSTLLIGLLAGIGSWAAASAATPQGELTVSFNQLPVKQIYTGKLFQQDWQSAVWDGTRGRACGARRGGAVPSPARSMPTRPHRPPPRG